MEQLTIKRVPIDSLHTDPANARLHGGVNLEAIAGSLARFGQAEPLVVQGSSKRVIAGNGRLAAMKKLGWVECDVVEVEVDDLTATALGIALNRTAELAEWDESVLARLLGELRSEEALAGVGFSDGEIDELLASLQPVSELSDPGPEPPPENPVSRRGDLWLLGEHRLLCGDSTSRLDVERLLGGERPLLMVTDQPFGVEYDPSWRNDAGVSKTERTGKVLNDDRVDWTDAWRLFPGDVAYVWHAGRFCAEVAASLEHADFEIRCQLIWAKSRFALSRGHYHWQHEPCWYAVRRGATAHWVGDRTQSTIWEIGLTDDGQWTPHGTQKPLECMERPMRNHDAPSVYEPFSGSGTSLISAQRLRRRCFAMELDPGYVDVAVRRWEKATGQEGILAGCRQRFAEVARERGVDGCLAEEACAPELHDPFMESEA